MYWVKNLSSLIRSLIFFGGYIFLCSLALAQKSNTNANNAVPARSATLATSQAITNVIIQNTFSGSGAFRFRLGEQAQPQEGVGMAAGENSNWSIWATPVVSSFKNNIYFVLVSKMLSVIRLSIISGIYDFSKIIWSPYAVVPCMGIP